MCQGGMEITLVSKVFDGFLLATCASAGGWGVFFTTLAGRWVATPIWLEQNVSMHECCFRGVFFSMTDVKNHCRNMKTAKQDSKSPRLSFQPSQSVPNLTIFNVQC